MIPTLQEAYNTSRSITEHVFATKLIIARAISLTDETVHLFLLGLSKAIDSIKRNTLIKDLKNVINHDGSTIAAKCGDYKSRFFSMDTGAPQENYASACELTFYLAKSLKTTLTYVTLSEEHNTIQSIFSIVPQNYQIDIDQQYTNHISKILTSISANEKMKDELTVNIAQLRL